MPRPAPASNRVLKMATRAGVIHAREVRSAAVEADAYDSISELTQAQSALERAVAIASRLPLPGLAQKG